MIAKKPWKEYTLAEIEKMKIAVTRASDDELFTPEYATAYLGKSSSTLQYWRSNRSDGSIYSKPGGHTIVKEPKNRYTNGYGIPKRLPTNDTRQT